MASIGPRGAIATITEVDRIVLAGMVFSGKHGVSEAERARSQRFSVDIELEADIARAARSDDISDTIDYRRVRAIAKEVIEGESAHLVETLAGRIARKALLMPRVKAVTVKVTKRPPSMRPIDGAAVVLRRARR
jgi:7,8-dihydroneopterin aldolase/epimerase/oxygenase